jgi:hypothetical protein
MALSLRAHTIVDVPTISIRVPDDDLAEIDRRAGELGTTRTGLMLRAVLGGITADEERLGRIEDRLDRVEASLFER